MSYIIKYNEINDFKESSKKQCQVWNDGIDGIGQSLSNFIGDMGMKGQTSDGIQNYLEEIHYPLLASMQQLLTEYAEKLKEYEEGYQDIDTSGKAVMTQDAFDDILTDIGKKETEFEETHKTIEDVLHAISDICAIDIPSDDAITTSIATMREHITVLKNDEKL